MHNLKREPQDSGTLTRITGPADTDSAVATSTAITADGGSDSALTTIISSIEETVTQPVSTFATTRAVTVTVTDAAQLSSLLTSETKASSDASITTAKTTSVAAETSTPTTKSSASDNLGTLVPAIVVPVATVLIITVIAVLLIRHRKRKKSSAAAVTADTTEIYYEKPELYAGPIDLKIAGPVQTKHELHSKSGTAQDLGHSLIPAKPHPSVIGHELLGQTNSNAPWARGWQSSLPSKLNSGSVLEAELGTTQDKQFDSTGYGSNHPRSPCAIASEGTIAVSTSEPQSSHTSHSILNDSELVEEADIAVQELGLISVRKRALTSQAQAAGRHPADMESRKGEEWRELLMREERVKARLDEIERQRNPG